MSHGRGFWPKCHLPIQAEFVPENKRTVGSGRTRTRRSRRAAIKLATGGAPFLSLYALQVTGSWLRVAQTWIRQDCLPVKSYRRGRPSPLNAFFKKLITKKKDLRILASSLEKIHWTCECNSVSAKMTAPYAGAAKSGGDLRSYLSLDSYLIF